MGYWLLKSEPETFGIQHLENSINQVTSWEGVRNYQARNFLRDHMKVGDLAFFYHSSCKIPGIVGVVEIIKSGYPDMTALNPQSPYYDPMSTIEIPRWYTVDVKLIQTFKHIVSLQEIRGVTALKDMVILKKGNRLSITPITPQEWQSIIKLASV
jgi:predicted RNA-binding protein with PUA-like domain